MTGAAQLPQEDFGSAAEVALGLLREKVGISFWMTTRIAGEELVVLNTVGSGISLGSGDAISWTDSLCWRMVAGSGPRVAPNVADVPAYSSSPFAEVYKVQAYVGAPLSVGDGKIYGTLAGLSNEVRHKLETHRPRTVGQAGRIDGITPAALTLLVAHVRRRGGTRSRGAA